ncbi:hypothetical protein HHI36_008379 [Cryptolaemus montrouzieri]|uniref:Uncharacterized protein n=1 Tax=Cryptolaemus montrouzieri TaxID=559131 RepID=A0ABD2MT81_9CUCU
MQKYLKKVEVIEGEWDKIRCAMCYSCYQCMIYYHLSKDISVSKIPANSHFFIWKLCKGYRLIDGGTDFWRRLFNLKISNVGNWNYCVGIG